ncbi:hypothetical protein WBP06_09615 [Novosphingobium sp. BL-8H]|uniref:hypothetical protein n=1 Tax=Novosphingobium sp. BL-8H TaxID=3127640 RepID=UPI0037581A47
MARMLFEVWVDRSGNQFAGKISLENDIAREATWKDAKLSLVIAAESDEDFLRQYHLHLGKAYSSVSSFKARTFSTRDAKRQKEYLAERSLDPMPRSLAVPA